MKTHPSSKRVIEGGSGSPGAAKTIPSPGRLTSRLTKRAAVPGPWSSAGDAAAWSTSRPLKGVPLRDARRHVRGGNDRRRGFKAGTRSTSGLRREGPPTNSMIREWTSTSSRKHAQRSPKGFLSGRRPRLGDDRTKRRLFPPAGHFQAGRDDAENAERIGRARRHLRQSRQRAGPHKGSTRLLSGANATPRRPAPTMSDPGTQGSRGEGVSPDLVSMVHGARSTRINDHRSRATPTEGRTGHVNRPPTAVQCGGDHPARAGRMTLARGGDGASVPQRGGGPERLGGTRPEVGCQSRLRPSRKLGLPGALV